MAGIHDSSSFPIGKLHNVSFFFECLYDQEDSYKCSKLRGRQLNAKVCGSESAIFLFLSFFLSFSLRPRSSTTISRKQFKYSPSFYHETDAYHSTELYNHLASS